MSRELTQRKALIKMAFANANQVTKGATKTDWVVRENITEKELGRFPSKLTDKEAFAILNLIREYELEALNVGIAEGKKRTIKVYNQKFEAQEIQMAQAVIENERLAEALDKATRGK